MRSLFALSLSILLGAAVLPARAGDDACVVYDGYDGPGKGKHIVLVSGDEEYRSEEALPMLGKILAKHHGFKCTVLFAIDPKTGTINPNVNNNIPGLDALKSADLMIIATRFRNLPDDQMKHIVDYVESGKPIIGMRTATHAFSLSSKTYKNYTWNNGGKEWNGGFGRSILGETWVAHHGGHGSQSTRGILVKDEAKHPILQGIKDGDIWGPSDVYTVKLPLPGNSKPLVLGQVLKGMKFDDPPLEGKKNDPMMPVAWTRTYETATGKSGRVFTTTMGASQDLAPEGSRRLIVNATFWALGMEKQITPNLDVSTVGTYAPTRFGNNVFIKGVTPASLVLK